MTLLIPQSLLVTFLHQGFTPSRSTYPVLSFTLLSSKDEGTLTVVKVLGSRRIEEGRGGGVGRRVGVEVKQDFLRLLLSE